MGERMVQNLMMMKIVNGVEFHRYGNAAWELIEKKERVGIWVYTMVVGRDEIDGAKGYGVNWAAGGTTSVIDTIKFAAQLHAAALLASQLGAEWAASHTKPAKE